MMKKIGISFSVFVLLAGLSLGFVVYSESGLKLLARTGEQLSGGRLEIGEVNGRLADRFSIESLHYADTELTIRAGYFELSWNPRALLAGSLHIYSGNLNSLHIVSTVEEEAAATTDDSFIPPDIELPFGISVDAFQLQDFTFSTSTETVVSIPRLKVETSGSATQLKFDALQVASEQYDFELQGTLGMADEWPINVDGTWKYRLTGHPELKGNGRITGSLADGGVKVELKSPYSALLTGQFSLNEGVSWRADLQATGIDPSVSWPLLAGEVNVEASLEGEYRDESFRADLDIAAITGKLSGIPLHLSGKARYDGKNVELVNMVFNSGDARLNVQGDIGKTLALVYDLYVPETAKFLPDLKGELQGEGNLSGNIGRPLLTANLAGRALDWQGLSVDPVHVSFTAELAADGVIHGTGTAENILRDTVAIDRVEIGLDGNLTDHRVKLSVTTGDPSLILTARGGWLADHWQGHIEDLKAIHSGIGQLQLDRKTPVTVGAEMMHVDNLCLSDKSGSLCFTGKLEKNHWQGDLQLAKIDPAILFPQWPGALSAKITGHGAMAEDHSTFVVDVEQLSGELKDLGVEGGGRIEQAAGKLNFSNIKVHYGNAQIALEGYLGDDIGIKFFLDIPNLGELVPEVQATLSGSGEISGNRRTPALDLSFSAKNGQVGELAIGTLQGDIDADLRSDGNIAVDIQGENLSSGITEIRAFTVQAQGSAAQHEFSLNAMSEPGNIQIDGQGSYDSQWTGLVNRIDFTSESYGDWLLQEPAAFAIGGESSELEYLCLQHQGAALCFEGAFNQTSGWLVEAAARSFPLHLLYAFGFINIPIQGELQADIQAAGQKQIISNLSAQATMPLLELEQTSRDDVQYTLQNTSATATFTGEVLEVQLSSTLMEDGAIQGSIRIEPFFGNFQDIMTQPLVAEFTANVDDLSFISLLTDGRLESTGNLVGDVKFAGTLTRPEAQGDLTLKNGELAIADLGITLDTLYMQFGSSAGGFDFTVNGRSGPGELQGSGNFSFTDDQGLQIQSQIVGESFELMNTNEYVFRVSPDLNLDYGARTTRLRGILAVPYARIVVNTDNNVIRPSKDIVIVDDTEQEEEQNGQLYMDLQIQLGKDVQVDAYGLESDIQGSFRLRDEPGRNLSASGELAVTKGTFSFYSVSLDITRGRLLFSGGNIENPGVDVRAHRKVDGNTVGVDITGTAQDLQFELFSEPYLEESDILSYILVGRPMRGSGDDSSLFTTAAVALGLRGANTITNRLGEFLPIDEIYLDKGEGETDFSVVVGKNVTENLFIGYDQSLLNGSGEITARYKLGRNFSVETKNSVNSTSGDIIYTIER